MSTVPSGHYPIERRAGEIERLDIQAAAMAPDSAIMLDRIGVKPGWTCLDLGCGPGGITGLMRERVQRSTAGLPAVDGRVAARHHHRPRPAHRR